jgi:SAM-dependent methyltransferase
MTNIYGSVLYPGRTFREAHPDRLATLAALYDMDPAPPARCCVLELGCGDGGNLIPMAYQYPDSEFVGIDLGRTGIEQGQRAAAALSLTNIALRVGDIMEFSAAPGGFDYIIAHGVYSWVPPPVRERILAIFASYLAPQGVAYVSYNAHPFSHLRDIARDMMLFHVRDIADPREQIAQARAILKFAASASDKNSLHGTVLRHQLRRVEALEDVVLFHDDLNAAGEAFLLHEVVDAAGRHGLQYLCDANFARRDLQKHSDEVKKALAEFSDGRFMERDQYQDFIEGHSFRRTLLCHRERLLTRTLQPDVVTRFHLASSATPVDDELGLAMAGIAVFKTQEGETLASPHALTTQAITHLGACWPAAVGFADLQDNACRRMGSASGGYQASEADLATLTDQLYRAACGGQIELHRHPPRLTTAISERPLASLVARKQAEAGLLITSLRHRTSIPPDDMRHFLPLVDGTRDIDALARDYSVVLANADVSVKLVTRGDVEQLLARLARAALLVT